MMRSSKNQSSMAGALMKALLNERSRFASEEEFKRFVVAEVRKLVTDLQSMNIELTMRPMHGGQPLSSVTQKLAQ